MIYLQRKYTGTEYFDQAYQDMTTAAALAGKEVLWERLELRNFTPLSLLFPDPDF